MRPKKLLLLLLSFAATFVVVNGERAYPEGCAHRDVSYYDYENLSWPPPFCQPLHSTEQYLLTRRLGTGKFSDVFEAVVVQQHPSPSGAVGEEATAAAASATEQPDDDDPEEHEQEEQLVVIKCLKPVAERKMRRELLVLHRCKDLAHLARLKGLVVSTSSSSSSSAVTASVVLEHAGRNAQWLCHPTATHSSSRSSSKPHQSTHHTSNTNRNEHDAGVDDHQQPPLSDYEIRYFLCHLLIALDGLHRAGIMHRDVKPRNVLINRSCVALPPHSSSATTTASVVSPLMLIDLGLADFYVPGCNYNVRVASRHYKAPELLTALELYDYAVDLWGVGCMLAGLLLRREPFFRGKDNVDQLGKIINVLGVSDLLQFLRKYNVPVTADIEREILQHTATHKLYQSKRQALLELAAAAASNHHSSSNDKHHQMQGAPAPTVPEDGLDLLEHLLVYDPSERWTAQQALGHPFFDAVRDRVQAEVVAAAAQQPEESTTSATITTATHGV